MELINIFFPPVCPICYGHTGTAVVCSTCEEKLKLSENIGTKYVNVDGKGVRVYYLYKYGSAALTRYIFALKKRANKELFRHAANKLLSMISDMPFSEGTLITNIPRRKVNVRLFGYDHAQRIAYALAQKSDGALVYKKLLKRRGFSKDQKSLNAVQRQVNVRGKFKAIRSSTVKSIILFDDVITTGNSFSECVRALRYVYGNDIRIIGLFLGTRNPDKTYDT